jgi:hypothetical protein
MPQTSDYEILRIRREYNYGSTEETAQAYLFKRFPTEAFKEKFRFEWLRLERLFGDKYLPLGWCAGCVWRKKTQEERDIENSQMVGAISYGEWKGETGTGKCVVALLNKEQEK